MSQPARTSCWPVPSAHWSNSNRSLDGVRGSMNRRRPGSPSSITLGLSSSFSIQILMAIPNWWKLSHSSPNPSHSLNYSSHSPAPKHSQERTLPSLEAKTSLSRKHLYLFHIFLAVLVRQSLRKVAMAILQSSQQRSQLLCRRLYLCHLLLENHLLVMGASRHVQKRQRDCLLLLSKPNLLHLELELLRLNSDQKEAQEESQYRLYFLRWLHLRLWSSRHAPDVL